MRNFRNFSFESDMGWLKQSEIWNFLGGGGNFPPPLGALARNAMKLRNYLLLAVESASSTDTCAFRFSRQNKSGKFTKHVVKGTENLAEKIGQTVLIEISALYTATCYLAIHALSDSAESFPWKSAAIKKRRNIYNAFYCVLGYKG